MALAGSKLGLLACAKERAIGDFGSVVSTVLVALRLCGEVEKRCSEEKRNRQAALNGVWAHVTLT